MSCLVITLLIYLSFYLLLSRRCNESLFHRMILAFLLTCSQIVLTELVLGLLNQLYLSYLLSINASIAAILIVLALKSRLAAIITLVSEDIFSLRPIVADMVDRYVISLMALTGLAYTWILVASYYLPPRGVDDLVYHLPPVFEYIKSHSIYLLPVDIRTHFAFPQNAELIFLWPAIFSHDQRMIDSVNIPFALFSIAIVYALARTCVVSRKSACFCAMLYALCPVVIMQSGSNYVDVMLTLFLLIGLYYVILYYANPRIFYLYAAALAIGMVCGMKYTAFFLTAPLHLLVIWRTRNRMLHLAGYAATVVLLCGWWYLRNMYVLGDPLYPMDFHGLLSTVAGGSGGGQLFGTIQRNLSRWILYYPLDDVGIGSYDGGFGLVFWGVGFPAWIYMLLHSVINYRQVGLNRQIILALMPIGFMMLLTASDRNVYLISRFSIFVVVSALVALASILELLDDKVCKSAIKIICIVASAVTICLMTVSESPSYRLGEVITDRINNRNPSEYKYIMNSESWYSELRFIWEPLDYMTRDDKAGLNCYLAADKPYFIMAPLYGSNLQNRMAILSSQSQHNADALVYSYRSKDILGHPVDPNIYYYNYKLDLEEMLANDDYVTVTSAANGCLLLNKRVMNSAAKQVLLKSYYEDTWPEAIMAARQIMPYIDNGVTVIASHNLAYGVRYLDMSRNNVYRVVLTPERMEEKVAIRKGLKRCYTFAKPLTGFDSKIVATTLLGKQSVGVFLNSVKP